MEYGKTKLIDMLTNVPQEGWSRQKVKDMVDTLWRDPIHLRWSGFEYTGATDAHISFNAADRVFRIWPKIKTFNFYHYKDRLAYYVITISHEVEIDDVAGLHLIYFDADEATKKQKLFSVHEPDPDEIREIYLDKVPVVWIYWVPGEEPDPGVVLYYGDSRHGSEWPSQVHWWNHKSLNSLRGNGLTITGMQADRDGSLNTHAKFSITSGTVWHSDLLMSIEGDTPASLPIWYMVNGLPYIVDKLGYSIYFTTGLCFNDGTGPTPATDDYYVLYHIFATNCMINPLISAMGLAEYETLGDAVKSIPYEIDMIRQTFIQSNLMLIDTLIFQANSGYGNDPKCRLVVAGESGKGLSEISFEFCVNPGQIETFVIDLYCTNGYAIEGAILESDGTLEGVQVQIGGLAVTGLDDMDVSTTFLFTATANNVADTGDRVTIVTSGTDTGTPTFIRGKILL